MIQHKGVHGLLVALAAAVTFVLAVSGTAQATPLYFAADSNQTPTGFSLAGGMPSPVDHVVPEGFDFTSMSVAAAPGADFELDFSMCLTPTSGTGCDSPIYQGNSYFGVVTLSLADPETSLPEGGLLLWISGMWADASKSTYGTEQVSITSQSATPLESISYIDAEGNSRLYYGVVLRDVDDQLIFRFDVTSMGAAGNPVFYTNGYAVPEPSTGLLLALGLVGLAVNRRR